MSAESDEMIVQVFCRLSQSQTIQWCDSHSYLILLVKKPNFGFVAEGSNRSDLVATVRGSKVNEEDRQFKKEQT